jgi:hypothetical protein
VGVGDRAPRALKRSDELRGAGLRLTLKCQSEESVAVRSARSASSANAQARRIAQLVTQASPDHRGGYRSTSSASTSCAYASRHALAMIDASEVARRATTRRSSPS